MLAQVYFPQSLFAEELDRYLADGWFRMGQSIFTTNFLNFKQHVYSALWLRLALNECTDGRKLNELQKINKRFRVAFSPGTITREQEVLFAKYRQRVSFEPSSSLHALLFGKASSNIYQTHQVSVYDQDKLIACGFFDLGKTSAAGITSFYDPDYKKNSLGKYLIYLKIDFCRKAGHAYFYPGYFVPGYAAFDYKLTIYPAAIEYFELSSKRWTPIKQFTSDAIPIEVMLTKLNALRAALQGESIVSELLYYDYFDANLVPDLAHMELFDFPVFLNFNDMAGGSINSLVVFDVRDRQYHWLTMKSVWMSDQPSTESGHYNQHLLKVDEDVIAASDPKTLANALSIAIKHELLKLKQG